MSKVCEENTFQKIFFEHSEHVRNYLYYKSGNLQLSEDLVQDAFAKLWEKCADVQPEKAKSFLFTIATNLFLNKIAHQKVVVKFENLGHSEADHQSPEFLLEENEFKKRLEQAIAELPENQRVVFLMSRIDQKKYREIAEELDISQKAVEKRMQKALVALRKIHKKV